MTTWSFSTTKGCRTCVSIPSIAAPCPGRLQLDEKAGEYIQEKLRGALWLIKSIHQRQRTIYKVTKSIVKFQRDFFDRGVDHLKPLVLRDVAEDIEMHESTVSRVTTNKYVQTPQGLFELKYFFNSGINTTEGDSVASESVKSKMQEIIADGEPAQTAIRIRRSSKSCTTRGSTSPVAR